MKRIGKMLAVILGGGLLVVVGAMFGPRTAHAIVSTLVQVANTSANAVPVSDLGPSNEPFWVALCSSDITGSTCGGTPVSFTVPSVTVDGKTAKRLVIEQVSGNCVGTAPADEFYLGGTGHDPTSENLPYGPGETLLYIQQIGPTFGSTTVVEQRYSQLVRYYGDPGQIIALFHTGQGQNNCSADIVGYLTTV